MTTEQLSSPRNDWPQVLLDALRLVNSSLEFGRVMELVLEGAMQVVKAEAGAVIMLDEDADELVIKVAGGPKSSEALETRFPRDKGIAGWVLESGQAQLVSDVEGHERRFVGVDEVTGFRTRSILGVPLNAREKAIGVLELINHGEGRDFTPADIPRITAFADLAALAIANAGAFRDLQAENQRLQARLDMAGSVVGRSAAMGRVLQQVQRVARRPITVLLRGETGTGKGVVAREIHNQSPRRGGPFVTVDCGALAESLWESELFGHKKGAYTGAASDRQGLIESASGGTVFLDEIGNAPIELQSRLLQVLQESVIRRVGETATTKVDVRLIAATNRDLEQAVAEGGFREDLFFRLNVFPIHLPPLRDRPGDIPSLVTHFLERYNGELAGEVTAFSEAALAAMTTHPWPGNIRELENLVKRLIVQQEEGEIELAHLPTEMQRARSSEAGDESSGPAEGAGSTSAYGVAMETGAAGSSDASELGRRPTLEEVERAAIVRALNEAGGNQSEGARLLSVSREKLRYRMGKYGIKVTPGGAQ